MDYQKAQLIETAKRKYGEIRPCQSAHGFENCFTVQCGFLIFWFNTLDDSTHVEMETSAGLL